MKAWTTENMTRILAQLKPLAGRTGLSLLGTALSLALLTGCDANKNEYALRRGIASDGISTGTPFAGQKADNTTRRYTNGSRGGYGGFSDGRSGDGYARGSRARVNTPAGGARSSRTSKGAGLKATDKWPFVKDTVVKNELGEAELTAYSGLDSDCDDIIDPMERKIGTDPKTPNGAWVVVFKLDDNDDIEDRIRLKRDNIVDDGADTIALFNEKFEHALDNNGEGLLELDRSYIPYELHSDYKFMARKIAFIKAGTKQKVGWSGIPWGAQDKFKGTKNIFVWTEGVYKTVERVESTIDVLDPLNEAEDHHVTDGAVLIMDRKIRRNSAVPHGLNAIPFLELFEHDGYLQNMSSSSVNLDAGAVMIAGFWSKLGPGKGGLFINRKVADLTRTTDEDGYGFQPFRQQDLYVQPARGYTFDKSDMADDENVIMKNLDRMFGPNRTAKRCMMRGGKEWPKAMKPDPQPQPTTPPAPGHWVWVPAGPGQQPAPAPTPSLEIEVAGGGSSAVFGVIPSSPATLVAPTQSLAGYDPFLVAFAQKFGPRLIASGTPLLSRIQALVPQINDLKALVAKFQNSLTGTGASAGRFDDETTKKEYQEAVVKNICDAYKAIVTEIAALNKQIQEMGIGSPVEEKDGKGGKVDLATYTIRLKVPEFDNTVIGLCSR